MKTRLLLFVALAVSAFFAVQTAKSGVLTFSDAETDVKGLFSNDLKSHVLLKNNAMTSIKVKVSFKVNNLVQGHKYYTCTPLSCYPKKVADWTSPAFTIEANSYVEKESFYVALSPDSIAGISSITVKIINYADETDFVEYTIVYEALAAGVNEYYTQNSVAYPNPATNSVNIKLDNKTTSSSQFKLFNEAGAVVSTLEVAPETDNFNVDLNGLQQGSYFFNLTDSNGKLSSGKIVIAR